VFCTHVVYWINEWIVTAIAHGEPIETEPNYVDIRIPKIKLTIKYSIIIYQIHSLGNKKIKLLKKL